MFTSDATKVTFTLNNGKTIPALGFGTANFREKVKPTMAAVYNAIKAGYRHIDAAWVYETEREVGEGIKQAIDEGLVTREELFVTTKVEPCVAHHPEVSLKESLERLQLDYVDLLLQHWPYSRETVFNEDGTINKAASLKNPINYDDYVDSYKRIEKLYQENPDKIKSIGVSNYSIKYLTNLLKSASVKPVVNQVELHPHLPQKDLVKFCEDNGILITAYSPLGANGAPNLEIPLVKQLAEKYGVTRNAILSSYHIKEGRIVIPKSTVEQRIKDAAVLVDLTSEDLAALTKFGEENPERFIHVKEGEPLGFDNWKA